MSRCSSTFYVGTRGRGSSGPLRARQAGIARRGEDGPILAVECELEVGHEGDHSARLIDPHTLEPAVLYWERRREP